MQVNLVRCEGGAAIVVQRTVRAPWASKNAHYRSRPRYNRESGRIGNGQDVVERACSSENPAQNNVDGDTSGNNDACNFEHGDSVTLSRHPCQPRCASFQVRRKWGEDFVLRTNRLVSIITTTLTKKHHPHRRWLARLFVPDIPSYRGYPDPAHDRGCQSSPSVELRPSRKGSWGAHCSA